MQAIQTIGINPANMGVKYVQNLQQTGFSLKKSRTGIIKFQGA